MQPHRHARFGRDARHAEDVVEMRVGQPDPDGLRARLLDLVEDQARLLARIHDGALPRLLVDDEVAVLGEHAVRDLDDLHFLPLALRNFSTAIAAVVASPTAVVICRVTWLRTSPAANSPAIEVIIRLSVIR